MSCHDWTARTVESLGGATQAMIQVVPMGIEALVLIGFGLAMLGVAVRNFRQRD